MRSPFITALVHDLTAKLWHDLPTGTDKAEFADSVALYLETFLIKLAEDAPTSHERLAYVRRRAKLIYSNEVWQPHHDDCDEQFLRHIIEQTLCDLLCDKMLRRQIDQLNKLHATATLYVKNHAIERRGKLIDEYRIGITPLLLSVSHQYATTYQQ